jgi:hypothetical protein
VHETKDVVVSPLSEVSILVGGIPYLFAVTTYSRKNRKKYYGPVVERMTKAEAKVTILLPILLLALLGSL